MAIDGATVPLPHDELALAPQVAPPMRKLRGDDRKSEGHERPSSRATGTSPAASGGSRQSKTARRKSKKKKKHKKGRGDREDRRKEKEEATNECDEPPLRRRPLPFSPRAKADDKEEARPCSPLRGEGGPRAPAGYGAEPDMETEEGLPQETRRLRTRMEVGARQDHLDKMSLRR